MPTTSTAALQVELAMSAIIAQSATANPDGEASTEDRHIALQLWWERNNEMMSKWFSSLKKEDQILCLRKASPDIPTQAAGSRESAGEKLNASDVLLPELTIDGLLGANGKLLSLFFSRRCQQADRCYFADLQLLTAMFARGSMPLFSQNALTDMDTPFVDPADPNENVCSLSPETSQEYRSKVLAHLITGNRRRKGIKIERCIHHIDFMCQSIQM